MVITGQTGKAKAALGFRKGLMQVRMGDYAQVREQLMAALGINNRNSLAAYASGRQEMKVTQAEAVEVVFKQHGITNNIWGE